MSTNLAEEKSKKHRQLSGVLNYVMNNLQGTGIKDENEEFINTVFKAMQEMSDAQCYFDSVTAPGLVDHAIYKMEAAKSQYVYLLRLAKDKGLRVNI